MLWSDVRIELSLQIFTKVYRFHRSGHLELFELAELPSIWIPFSRQQVQACLLIFDRRVIRNKHVRLVDVQIELFIVVEVQVLHDS